jgi:glycosyltransferase involved in cell wall biosynthesis
MHHRYALTRVAKSFSEIYPDINISVYVGVKEISYNIIQALFTPARSKKNHVFYFTGLGRLYTDFYMPGRIAFWLIVYLCSIVSNSVLVVENKTDKKVLEKLSKLPVFEIHGSGFFEKNNGPFSGYKIKRKSTRLSKLLYVSRFGKSKYTDLILDLAKKLPPNIHLDVLGSDIKGNWFSREFERLEKKKKNITFQAWTNDRKEILSKLNAADVLLYGSKREGCPFTVMEALEASALPIVTKTPGCLDLSEALGTPSLEVVQLKEIKYIELAYERFFESDAKELISRHALSLYSSENVEKEFFEIFRNFQS